MFSIGVNIDFSLTFGVVATVIAPSVPLRVSRPSLVVVSTTDGARIVFAAGIINGTFFTSFMIFVLLND